jgi:hypothetical protein
MPKYTLAEQRMRANAFATFGYRCGVRITEAWRYGIELLRIDATTYVVILCDESGPVCVVQYTNHELCSVYARHIVGEMNA